jgi:threonylcarbamoyladenosine tRNA methylthiotransferase MtaB
MQEFTRLHIGQTRKTLFEAVNKNNMMEGYTDNYIKVSVPFKQEWINQVIDWTI